MKPFKLLLLASLFPTLCISQIEYAFDYLAEYEMQLYIDSIPTKKRIYVLTNSKDNNYSIMYSEIDSLNSNLEFKDYDKLHTKEVFSTIGLQNNNKIQLDCRFINRSPNPYKLKAKQYDFLKLKDTLLDDKSYLHYRLKSNKPKYEKKKNWLQTIT